MLRLQEGAIGQCVDILCKTTHRIAQRVGKMIMYGFYIFREGLDIELNFEGIKLMGSEEHAFLQVSLSYQTCLKVN